MKGYLRAVVERHFDRLHESGEASMTLLHPAWTAIYQRYGYATEYQGWCINQTELLEAARGAGLELIQEFITGERVVIYNAPEPCQVRGYLFKPKRQ